MQLQGEGEIEGAATATRLLVWMWVRLTAQQPQMQLSRFDGGGAAKEGAQSRARQWSRSGWAPTPPSRATPRSPSVPRAARPSLRPLTMRPTLRGPSASRESV
eukprot:592518-Pyramimonas_sp.AAC.1